MAIANLLRAEGHCVALLINRPVDFEASIFQEYYNDIELFFIEGKGLGSEKRYSPSGGNVSAYNLAYSIAVEEAFGKIYTSFKPDIVIAADFGAELLAVLLQRAGGKYPAARFMLHLSGGLHEALAVYEGGTGEEFSSELEEPQNRLTCSMENLCLKLVDEIITPTEIAWEEVTRRLDIKNKVVHTIPNLQGDKLQTANSLASSDTAEKNILFIGRLDRHKGADRILRVFMRYLEKYGGGTRLILLGRDCYWKEYGRSFLEEWNEKIPYAWKSFIEFKGQVSHVYVKEYLATSMVCLFPSRWEVFGNVALEAMAAGVPAFVSKGTGLEEVVGKDLASFALDFEETETSANALHDFLSDRDAQAYVKRIVRKRAFRVINNGETGYKKLVTTEPRNNSVNEQSLLFTELPHLLKAVTEITGALATDADRVAQYCGFSEEKIKHIVQGKERKSSSLLGRLPFVKNK
ncbi:MAG: hypothetical protein BA863_05000 [Desulfovibrio sp. S3730MH75]|nr:MAG: hypothetical protein BA863_05000 [Desulfovibrio sp. S3730MH75]